MYVLKHFGRQLLHAKLGSASFAQCVADMCLYWKCDEEDSVVVGVHVDDLLATVTDAVAVDRFFDILASFLLRISVV